MYRIQLSKKGTKHAGQYEAIVDDEDADLDQYNWHVLYKRGIPVYAIRNRSKDYNEILMHRIILARKLERDSLLPHEQVDHIDGNPRNNLRDNLRLATNAENLRNRGKQKDNTSGFKGVYWHRKNRKWIAQIRSNNRVRYIGSFTDRADAHAAYCRKADELHQEFANYGKVENDDLYGEDKDASQDNPTES